MYKSIFCTEQSGIKFGLFNKMVEESHIDEVMDTLKSLSDYWYPKQTNAFDLYVKAGNDLEKINSSELGTKDWDASWADMPKAAIDYLKSLPEFDAAVFKEVTGLNATSTGPREVTMAEVEAKFGEPVLIRKEEV